MITIDGNCEKSLLATRQTLDFGKMEAYDPFIYTVKRQITTPGETTIPHGLRGAKNFPQNLMRMDFGQGRTRCPIVGERKPVAIVLAIPDAIINIVFVYGQGIFTNS